LYILKWASQTFRDVQTRREDRTELMQIQLEWNRPLLLKDGRSQNLIYCVDLNKLPHEAGIYILGRRWGRGFEAV
jgi:hypothetical protein